jgi:hypothetical protein
MTQIIRLTETDLKRLVKRIINEAPFEPIIKKGEGHYDNNFEFEGPYSRKDKSDINKMIRDTKEQLENAKFKVDQYERALLGYQKMRNSWTKRGEK